MRELYASEVLKTPLSSLDAKWPREIGAKSASVREVAAAARAVAEAEGRACAEAVLVRAEPPPTPRPVVVRPVEDEPVAEAPKPAKPAREPKIKPELPEGAPRPRVEKNLPRFTLNEDAPVEKAPSIGPKTAKRLEAVGVRTIADLLAASRRRQAAADRRAAYLGANDPRLAGAGLAGVHGARLEVARGAGAGGVRRA